MVTQQPPVPIAGQPPPPPGFIPGQPPPAGYPAGAAQAAAGNPYLAALQAGTGGALAANLPPAEVSNHIPQLRRLASDKSCSVSVQ